MQQSRGCIGGRSDTLRFVWFSSACRSSFERRAQPAHKALIRLLSRLASRTAASGTRALLARASQRSAQRAPRRLLSEKPAEKAAEKAAAPEAKPGWWSSAEFWGGLGALAGWGMTGAAIYDAQFSSPEKISMTMTPVMIIYSSLFCRWAIIVKPQNLLLAACHGSNVVAQFNQMR